MILWLKLKFIKIIKGILSDIKFQVMQVLLKGEDVVCAAVSALSQTALVSLVEVIGISERN